MSPFDETLLDDEGRRRAVDRSDVLRSLAGAGAQVRRAVAIAAETDLGLVAGGERPRAVHVAAVGGAEGVGTVLDLLAARTGPVLLTADGSGPLPGWVGTLDLVVAVSLSGRADGPVRQAREAARRGAQVLTIGAPDSPLAEAAHAARGVHLPIEPGSGHSRAALWGMVARAVLAVAACGVVDVPGDVLGDVADRLDAQAEACRPDAEYFVNPAKTLALDLSSRVPVVLGDGPVTGVAARRASTMLARTARTPSTWGRLPDAAAQVLACLSGPFTGAASAPDGGRDVFADPYIDGPAGPELGLLLLRDPRPTADGRPEEVERHNTAQSIADHAQSAGVRVLEHWAGPGHDLARLAELVALTDYAATYLAIGHGLDPASAPGISELPLPRKAPE
ncbi:phosphosugar isomerase [Janibacter hoylei PVAS-1]|uniref:Phosphosugar isomerase n=1 Tax=Janibacter hoylei PVAS-1 TaxID=1210046 RepID=K1E4S6_9MICO|nr:SIS domain-containing protein [Janibacter hoylei]EKA60367.1 phosphosugar isomerase [Janibacter hoylei PVAS-1]RWU85795.1 phosphosugar isomerase [Janibacter hoylei PVAS-1]